MFARLTDPARELPAMFEPVTEAAPWDDPPTLVAHNAQFEVEVLLNHGVALDVECTMIAAKCLLLVAVAKDEPQPVKFGLADWSRSQRTSRPARDKSVRDRDWRLEASLDDEGVAYGLQDARDALELWQLYRPRLEDEGLLEGYQVMRGALLPTAAANFAGLPLDTAAHGRAHALARGRGGGDPQGAGPVVRPARSRTTAPRRSQHLDHGGGARRADQAAGGAEGPRSDRLPASGADSGPTPAVSSRARDLDKVKVGKLLVRPMGPSLWDARVAAQAGGLHRRSTTVGDLGEQRGGRPARRDRRTSRPDRR